MSRFRKLSHSIWYYQYHIVWVPKYRYRILTGATIEAAEVGIRAICGYARCEVIELNVQPGSCALGRHDSTQSICIGIVWTFEGADGNKIISSVSTVKEEALLGQSFLGKRFCVDSVGLDADMIRKYVRYQEKKEQQMEQLQLGE